MSKVYCEADDPHCTEDEPCQSCCDHSDSDEYECLICGYDLTEDRMCAAHSLAEGDR